MRGVRSAENAKFARAATQERIEALLERAPKDKISAQI
jgi:hypothetical protein